MSDLISRQAALEVLRQYEIKRFNLKEPELFWNDAIDRCVEEIEDLPAAQRWIPVSERLPEEDSEVLVTTNNGTVMQCDFLGFVGIHFVWKSAEGRYVYWDKEVVAWMPLPKKYQEDNNEQSN